MKEVFEKAILTYGQTAQEDVAIEEMGELITVSYTHLFVSVGAYQQSRISLKTVRILDDMYMLV